MKTLKITLLLLAILTLTVSGSSNEVVGNETKTEDIQKPTFDLIAKAKKKRMSAGQA